MCNNSLNVTVVMHTTMAHQLLSDLKRYTRIIITNLIIPAYLIHVCITNTGSINTGNTNPGSVTFTSCSRHCTASVSQAARRCNISATLDTLDIVTLC